MAVGVGAYAIAGDDEGTSGRAGGSGAVTDDIVAGARDGTVYIRASGLGQEAERVGSSLASYCRAVEDVESGDERDLTVITGPGRREQTVAVKFD